MLILSVDGIDGAGKTTVINQTVSQLEDDHPDWDVKTLKFPTEYPDEPKGFKWYLRDMYKTLPRVFYEGADVLLLDRSFVSTAVYQGFDYSKDTPEHTDAEKILGLGLQMFSKVYRESSIGEIEHVFCWLRERPDICCDRIEAREDATEDEAEGMSTDALLDWLKARHKACKHTWDMLGDIIRYPFRQAVLEPYDPALGQYVDVDEQMLTLCGRQQTLHAYETQGIAGMFDSSN